MTGWAAVERELDAWATTGRTATLWWRDDDAGTATPPLKRLLALAARCGQPLALAVIPADTDEASTSCLAGLDDRVQVLQHGFAHRNHARADEKKCELLAPGRRPEVLTELARGGAVLKQRFGDRAKAILVPPWNRIHGDLLARLPGLGFTGLSTYKPRAAAEPLPGLRQVNCHVDLMLWGPERRFAGDAAVLTALVDHLAARRLGRADPDEATGIMTHHAVHDEAAWEFLEALFDRLSRHPAAAFLSAEAAFSAGEKARTAEALGAGAGGGVA